MKYMQLPYVCLVAVGLLVTCSSAQNGECSNTKYKQAVSSVTYAVYREIRDNYRYSCGFLWLGRCRGTRKRRVSSQAIKFVTRVESILENDCCNGYIGFPPNCIIITCPTLRNPSNGNVDYSSIVYQSEARYHCNLGYSLIGESRSVCQLSGQWTTSQPSCRPITCSIPQQPMNGYVSYTSTRYNHAAYYICRNSYKLVGSPSRTCTVSGQWSGAQPSCLRLQCPSLSFPENGNVTVSSYYPSGITMYNCHYGYRLVGSTPVRVCESEETWTGMAPSCQQIRCPPPTQPGNGTVNVTSNTVDGIALFYCLPTHDLDGSNRRVCTESGEWNGIQPQCVEKCTPFIGFNKPFLKIKEGESKTVCLKTCSCYLSSNLTLELKATSQDDGLERNTDLIVPSELIVNATSNCFEVTAVDDNLLEGFEAKLLYLYKPNGERYHICEDSQILPVSIVDNDELTIGFENSSMNVLEAAGTIEVCVVVSAPNETVPIPDVSVYVQTMPFGEAKQGEDYSSIDRLPLTLSHANRRACFPITINNDSDIEDDEQFILLVKRNSLYDLPFPLTLQHHQLTLKIMDDDGISVGFKNYKIKVKEGDMDTVTVCIEARFSSQDIRSFSVFLNTRSLTAKEGSDYEGFNNFLVGPFTPAKPRKCFSLKIINDLLTEQDEEFTLEITGEPDYVIVTQRTTLVTINNDDEPCDPAEKNNDLRRLILLDLHCDDCKYPHECVNWEEKPGSTVEVPKDICSSKKRVVEHCTLNATSGENCNAKEELKASCVLTTGQKFASEIHAGNGVSTQSKTVPPRDATSSQSRGRRQAGDAHCYEPQNALSLNPHQCNAYPLQCPYSDNDIRRRDPQAPCTNRSVLFVLDSSYSVGYDLFKDVSISLSHLVEHLCGDVQFGLLKFSSGAYLEFCFDCYSNDERDKLRDRIINTEYRGHSSYTGYATLCANRFMFGESNSCGNHEGRCVDIIFVTDGQSSDRAFVNVCDHVECLHRNPIISDRLKIYVLNIGMSAFEEARCITKHSKRRDDSLPIFNFDSIEDLIIELNNVVRLIGQDQQKHRESASKFVYQCS